MFGFNIKLKFVLVQMSQKPSRQYFSTSTFCQQNISRIFQRAQHKCVDLASHLMVFCLHSVRFDYCKFVELDYIPMEAGCMVSMRPTKGYGSSKSPSKGLSSTRSPDRHVLSESSPSTPRSRLVLCHSLTLLHQ